MKQVKILGEEFNISFNMAVEIAYEEETGEPFSTDSLNTQKNSTALYWSAIKVNNPQTTLTRERLINEAQGYEFNELATAVIEAMTEWMTIPSIIKDEEPKGEVEKN